MRIFRKTVETIPTLDPTRRMELTSFAFEVLLAAWESDPLDYETLFVLSSNDAFRKRLPDAVRNLVDVLYRFRDVPLPFEETFTANKVKELFPQLPPDVPPFSLLWWKYLRTMVSISRSWEWFERFLEGIRWPEILEGLRLRLLLDGAIFRRDIEKARALLSLLSQRKVLSAAGIEWFRGNLALFNGDRDGAILSWRFCLLHRPWHVNLILRLYDILSGVDRFLHFPSGSIAVCLYSYNKREALQETLSSLAESELRNARIFVLINGSTDGSQEMVKSWQDRLGVDRLIPIFLPVNVGAPAARNWLMHHPLVQNADWIAYLDDDAVVPPDWLARLGAAVERYPQSGAYGCKVVDSETPYLIQSADYHLVHQRSYDDRSNIPPYRWSTVHHELEDGGEFDYLRPCIHVTGCCHLFSREALLSCGDFDLRYSPSQFDDLDHDFQMALLKRPAVYTGFLTVRHMNNTAKHHRQNPQARRSGQANWYKLMNKFAGRPFQEMFRWETTLLWNDFLKKLYTVQEVLKEGI